MTSKTGRLARGATALFFALSISMAMAWPCYAQNDDGVTAPSGMQKVYVRDPALNMDAFGVIVPAKWHFEGTVIQGTSCFPVPFLVFRTTSPDGLTQLEKFPQLDWKWGTAPGAQNAGNGGCLPLKKTMTAQEMLKYMAGVLKVEYVNDVPMAEDLKSQAKQAWDQAQSHNANGQKPGTVDLASAEVSFKNGTFAMKGLLSGTVHCMTNSVPAPQRGQMWTSNVCMADIRYVTAPEAKYDAAVKELDPHNAGAFPLQKWGQAWMAGSAQRTQQNINAIQQRGEAARAQTVQSAQAFQHSQDVQQQMHNEFLSTMQRGTDMSMNRTAEAGNARHTATSDWVDYSLDQQTVRDPATGQVSKVSSQYSYTWVDSTGRTSYQTNDVNVDPNGSLPGNWTRQQVVHGDGSSQ